MPFDPIDFIVGRVADVISEAAKHEVLRDPGMVAFLNNRGIDTLEDRFSSVYVNTVVILAREHKPMPLLELFKDKRVVKAFEDAWRTNKPFVFTAGVMEAIDALAVGDEIKRQRIDVRKEMEHFEEEFRELVQKARTPGEQEHRNISIENRDLIRKMYEEQKQLRGNTAAMKWLNTQLDDISPERRYYAAEALGEVGDEQALSELERVARQDEGSIPMIMTEPEHDLYVADAAREATEKIRRRIKGGHDAS